MIFRAFTLFLLILLAYNATMLISLDINATLATTIYSLALPSKAVWQIQIADIFIIIGIITLYFEMFKATKTSAISAIEHATSMFIFVIFLLEFILVEGAGTSTFAALTVMSLVDVLAGFTVTIGAARRDVDLGNH